MAMASIWIPLVPGRDSACCLYASQFSQDCPDIIVNNSYFYVQKWPYFDKITWAFYFLLPSSSHTCLLFISYLLPLQGLCSAVPFAWKELSLLTFLHNDHSIIRFFTPCFHQVMVLPQIVGIWGNLDLWDQVPTLHSFIYFKESNFIYLLAASCGMQDLPGQGLNPCPLQWKRRVLTSGPSGKSQAPAL